MVMTKETQGHHYMHYAAVLSKFSTNNMSNAHGITLHKLNPLEPGRAKIYYFVKMSFFSEVNIH